MRLPRFRFTVRRMMVAVAIVAAICAAGPPAIHWLVNTARDNKFLYLAALAAYYLLVLPLIFFVLPLTVVSLAIVHVANRPWRPQKTAERIDVGTGGSVGPPPE